MVAAAAGAAPGPRDEHGHGYGSGRKPISSTFQPVLITPPFHNHPSPRQTVAANHLHLLSLSAGASECAVSGTQLDTCVYSQRSLLYGYPQPRPQPAPYFPPPTYSLPPPPVPGGVVAAGLNNAMASFNSMPAISSGPAPGDAMGLNHGHGQSMVMDSFDQDLNFDEALL